MQKCYARFYVYSICAVCEIPHTNTHTHSSNSPRWHGGLDTHARATVRSSTNTMDQIQLSFPAPRPIASGHVYFSGSTRKPAYVTREWRPRDVEGQSGVSFLDGNCPGYTAVNRNGITSVKGWSEVTNIHIMIYYNVYSVIKVSDMISDVVWIVSHCTETWHPQDGLMRSCVISHTRVLSLVPFHMY